MFSARQQITAICSILFPCSPLSDYLFVFAFNSSHHFSTDQQVLTGYRVGKVESMAYDWTSKVLFWTSSSYRVVSAYKVTDGSRRDIVEGLKNPRGIAVHPSAG